jgi:xanthine dehydrogenase YagS FAD-binding subunit
MKAFEYAAPATVADAAKLLAGPNAAALAGGTDLIGRMKDYVTSPDRVVYLKDIKELAAISGDPKAGGLIIGAGTRLSDLVGHKGIRESYPALWQATVEIGSAQIRNMSTVGGNLLQRPRCWYYRAGFGLLGMKDGKSLVRAGDNRYHAIFQTALGAQATIRGPKGERTVKVEEIYQVPRKETDSELAIKPGEILTHVTIPAAGKNASYEARQKQAQDWPLVMAAVNLTMDNDKVSAARVVIYGVAPTPWRSEASEKALIGQRLTPESAAAAGAAAVEGAAPLSMNAYKVPLTRTVVKRALSRAVNPKGYWEEA